MNDGALRFARYAYPPNALGYCGPADSGALLEYADAGVVDGGLTDLARRFDGAWPYLALIGAANGRSDPLDDRVVEAYWLGNRLLEHVPARLLAAHLDARFAARAGHARADLAGLAVSGGRAHHNFHVFAVYPWVGMLRAGFAEEPLRVLNYCRVRWGTVLTVHNGGRGGRFAQVCSTPLVWGSHGLALGAEETETVALSPAQAAHIRPGGTVSLHWDWICETLTTVQARRLRHYTDSQLRLVNFIREEVSRR